MFWDTKKSEKEDEKISAAYSQIVEDLGDKRFLYRFLLICIAANLFFWFGVLLFPNFVYDTFSRISDVNDKLAVTFFGFPFAFGLFMAYCLCRLKFSDIEDNKNLESDMMASFNYQSHSTKRWYIWLFSVLIGILNIFLIIFVTLTLSNNL